MGDGDMDLWMMDDGKGKLMAIWQTLYLPHMKEDFGIIKFFNWHEQNKHEFYVNPFSAAAAHADVVAA